MSDVSNETTPRRSLKENLQETLDILQHSNMSMSEGILLAVAATAVALLIL